MPSFNSLVDYMDDLFGHLLEPPFFYGIIAALVILLVLWLWYSYGRKHQGIVPFKTQGGTIEIAPGTLRGIMQHAANSVPGVEKATCQHFMKGRRVGVKVAIHLKANSRLKDVEANIKKGIKNSLLDQFGMETVEPIDIRVTKIIGDPVYREMPRMLEPPAEEQDMIDLAEDDDRPYADETKI